MKPRQIYLKKKRKNKDGSWSYAITGMQGNSDKEICAVGTAEEILLFLMENPHFRTQEKRKKYKQKYLLTNFKPSNGSETAPKVRTRDIKRSFEKHGKHGDRFDPDDEMDEVLNYWKDNVEDENNR